MVLEESRREGREYIEERVVLRSIQNDHDQLYRFVEGKEIERVQVIITVLLGDENAMSMKGNVKVQKPHRYDAK